MVNRETVDFVEKLLSASIGIVGTWLALRSFYERKHKEVLDRYADSQKKEYAAQRDFEHLRRNQEQMKESFRELDDELSKTREDMRELKGMLTTWTNRMNASLLDGFGHKPE